MEPIFSARVFYGTFAPRSSALGQVLDAYLTRYGSNPAPAAPGVVVSTTGSRGVEFVTVEIDMLSKPTQPWARELDERRAHIDAPAAIPPAQPDWHTRITLFLRKAAPELVVQGVLDAVSPIGFHVAATRM